MSKQCNKCKLNKVMSGMKVCVDCFKYITHDCSIVTWNGEI